MSNEFTDRQQAIKLRLAGQSVEDTRTCGGAGVCRVLGRTRARSHLCGVATLAPRAGRVRVAPRAPMRAAVRFEAGERSTSSDCSRLGTSHFDGPTAACFTDPSRDALQPHGGRRHSSRTQTLHVRPLPCVRTTPAPTAKQVRVERVLQRNGIHDCRLPHTQMSRMHCRLSQYRLCPRCAVGPQEAM